MMSKDFLAIQMDDGNIVLVTLQPSLIAWGGDIHRFEIEKQLGPNAFNHV